jgi:hypothetical protein
VKQTNTTTDETLEAAIKILEKNEIIINYKFEIVK